MVVEHESYLSLLKRCLTASIYDQSGWQMIEGPMVHETGVVAAFKRSIVSMLARRGLMLVRTTPMNPVAREQGLDWPLFGFTMVGTKRLENLHNCIEACIHENIPGDFVETGVWRGGSCILAKAIFNLRGIEDRAVWCCDSFEGMPVAGAKDLSIDRVSDFSDRESHVVSQETVAENFRKFGLLDAKVKFLKGWFCDTLPTAPIKTISVLRMDGDLYQSTIDTLNNLYDKVSKGGFIIVDDYYSWKGCKQAVDEFRKSHHIDDRIIDIDPHAVYWRKTT